MILKDGGVSAALGPICPLSREHSGDNQGSRVRSERNSETNLYGSPSQYYTKISCYCTGRRKESTMTSTARFSAGYDEGYRDTGAYSPDRSGSRSRYLGHSDRLVYHESAVAFVALVIIDDHDTVPSVVTSPPFITKTDSRPQKPRFFCGARRRRRQETFVIVMPRGRREPAWSVTSSRGRHELCPEHSRPDCADTGTDSLFLSFGRSTVEGFYETSLMPPVIGSLTVFGGAIPHW